MIPGEGGRYVQQWSPAEDEIIRTYARNGASAGRCARYLNRTKNAVIGRAHRIGVHFGPQPIPPQQQNPIRMGQHKPWLNQNMSAVVPVRHGRRMDDDE